MPRRVEDTTQMFAIITTNRQARIPPRLVHDRKTRDRIIVESDRRRLLAAT